MSFPDVRDMVATHTLAHNIITRHNTPHAVLDSSELDMLKRFCLDPSSNQTILEAEGMLDSPETTPGTAAIPIHSHGSLVGWCIAQSDTDTPALLDREIEMLRQWFDSCNVDISSGAGPMIRTHTLAYNVINRPFDIFDQREMSLLRRFCADPSAKSSILADADMLDDPEARPGTKAQAVAHASLAGYCIATYGTEQSVLEDREIELLRDWFAAGGAEEEVVG